MPDIRKITGEARRARKRVAAYARVSADSESAGNSLSAQISHYSRSILSNPEWDYAGFYADEGVSGTRKTRREQFQRLLRDCDKGKIDLILTKSVSRFARNTLDLLETLRHLREIGVEVFFERENITSFGGEGELMVTILASFAQEESRSISENVKWGIRKGFEAGKQNAFVLYGYRMISGKIEIVPKEAEVVRLIYSNFLDGLTMRDTEKQLSAMGVRSYYGGHFSKSAIYDILRQEKYTGNMLLQKYFIKDHISHKKCRNRGELPMYYVEHSHEPIIDREIFERVQAEIARRRELGIFANPRVKTNCFTGKIVCAHCEKNFRRYTKSRRNGGSFKIWRCSVKNKFGTEACGRKDIGEEALKIACRIVMGTEKFEEELFGAEVDKIRVIADLRLEFLFVSGEKRIINLGE